MGPTGMYAGCAGARKEHEPGSESARCRAREEAIRSGNGQLAGLGDIRRKFVGVVGRRSFKPEKEAGTRASQTPPRLNSIAETAMQNTGRIAAKNMAGSAQAAAGGGGLECRRVCACVGPCATTAGGSEIGVTTGVDWLD